MPQLSDFVCVGLLVLLGEAVPAVAQDATTPYPEMAPIEEYLMPDRNAEIALARSAAPGSISRDATILVLGREGYETAVEGKNGFVCMVDRGWTGPIDWPERWNPKIRAAVCLNPQAARSILPIGRMNTAMVLAGRSRAEIVSAMAAGFTNGRLPDLENGSMAYMMAESAYLTDQGEHNLSHLMFFTDIEDGQDWGSGAAGSPIFSSSYWSVYPQNEPEGGLPPILVFLVGLPNWSDGTPVSD